MTRVAEVEIERGRTGCLVISARPVFSIILALIAALRLAA